MGLYINGIEYDILSPSGRLVMEVDPYHVVTNGLKLFSSDDCMLKDANGVYLTVTEYLQSLSSDGSILTDIEDKYLTMKKG